MKLHSSNRLKSEGLTQRSLKTPVPHYSIAQTIFGTPRCLRFHPVIPYELQQKKI